MEHEFKSLDIFLFLNLIHFHYHISIQNIVVNCSSINLFVIRLYNM